jgi:flap endonuclease-1
MRDGSLLRDSEGRITSHLVGLAFRTTRLISDYNMRFIFVFDGKPPQLKRAEIERRKKNRSKAEQEYKLAVEIGDYRKAFSKAIMTGHLEDETVTDAKRLITLLGIPWIQAPSEGEAQATYLVKRGDVWACNSQDYDTLLYGVPRLVRYLTISGEEWLPKIRRAKKLEPELIDLKTLLNTLKLTREQLLDLAILIGTDYNEGVHGIGPKTALKLSHKYGCLENIPTKYQDQLPKTLNDIRNSFLKPEVTDTYTYSGGELDEKGLLAFLCDEHDFSKDRVNILLQRMKAAQKRRALTDWM